jgi:hypothetical protein
MLGRSSGRGPIVPIHLASRRRTVASLTAEFPDAWIIAATSKAMGPWVRNGDVTKPLSHADRVKDQARRAPIPSASTCRHPSGSAAVRWLRSV